MNEPRHVSLEDRLSYIEQDMKEINKKLDRIIRMLKGDVKNLSDMFDDSITEAIRGF